jgi:tRNA threonylcarbamoyladenosine biosynthesis protein TsaE
VSWFKTQSEEETIAFGRALARSLPPKCTVLLIGNLGAGKTALAKGILSGLGVASIEEVTSPTFTLIHEYGDGRAYHLDLYRLDTEAEIETLGLDDLFDRDSAILIEWGERFPRLMPPDRIEIELTPQPDESRAIEVRELGSVVLSLPPQ